MADSPENDPAAKQEPNLELPSLPGFGRKKKSKVSDSGVEQAADTSPATPPSAPPASQPPRPPAAPPAAPPVRSTGATRTPPPMPPPRRAPEPAASEAPVAQSAAGANQSEAEPTLVQPAVAPPVSRPAKPAKPAKAPKPPKAPRRAKAAKPEKVKTEKAPKVAKEQAPLTLPRLDPRIAAALTGIVVGLISVCLIILALRGCEAVRGVGSCGGFGVLALLAILGIEVLLGAAMLKAWSFTDPLSTSFLAVGVVAVLAMLFFLDSIDSVWMFLVIPVLTALAYVLSWWIARTFIDETMLD
ncbi:MAG: hypothetical protein ABIN79_08835 [Marmoricola sp.]